MRLPGLPLPAALPFTSTLRGLPLASRLHFLHCVLALSFSLCLSRLSLRLSLPLSQLIPSPNSRLPRRRSVCLAPVWSPHAASVHSHSPTASQEAAPRPPNRQPANCTSSTKRAQLIFWFLSRRGGAELALCPSVCMSVCLLVRRRGGKIIIRWGSSGAPWRICRSWFLTLF